MEAVERRLGEEVRLDDLQVDPATTHLVGAGGKRLRPALVLLAAELGPRPGAEAVLDSAVAVELTHLASLYHDDVMDDAPMRRGVPSVQSLFGNSVAILAGDVLFARASLVTSKLGPQAVKLHAMTFERLCQGQLHETIGPRASVSPRDHYIRVLADKTGSLIATSARYGVLFSGGSWELADALAQYGECIGVAFQLADDVIDIESDAAVTGKTPGTDLREGVDTMPTLLLRELGEKGALDVEGDGRGARAQARGGALEVRGRVHHGGDASARLRDQDGVLRVALGQAAAIIHQHVRSPRGTDWGPRPRCAGSGRPIPPCARR